MAIFAPQFSVLPIAIATKYNGDFIIVVKHPLVIILNLNTFEVTEKSVISKFLSILFYFIINNTLLT